MRLDAKVTALALAAVAAVCGGANASVQSPERAVTRGSCPVFSPDGGRIAFQRLEGSVFKIGVVASRGGDVEWIEEGPGNAAYPEWTPAGGLVYMAGHDTETAYEAWRGNSKNGYGLWLWECGKKRRLTSGRCRDYTPSVSPDGRKAYFVTTRGVASESASFSMAASSRIAEIDLPAGGEPRILMDSPNGNNSGFVQPAVSPDGSLLVWGHLEDFFDKWRIFGTRIDRLDRREWCSVTPRGLAAIAPRWHPGGDIICFSGFRKGDPGWGVWVESVKSGKVRRLATGENPCFSPDGRSIAYDRGGTIYVRAFGADDMPDETIPDVRCDAEPEKVLWSAENVARETNFNTNGTEFAFGTDRTIFTRVRVRLGGSKDLRQLLICDYEEHELALQTFVSYALCFSTRDSTGRYLAIRQDRNDRPGEHTFTAIRTADALYLSVDGAPPTVSTTRGNVISLGKIRRFVVGRGLKAGEAVLNAEVGTGWPSDVPKSRKREDLFK